MIKFKALYKGMYDDIKDAILKAKGNINKVKEILFD